MPLLIIGCIASERTVQLSFSTMAQQCIRMTLPLRERFYHLSYRNSCHISPPTLQLYLHRHASSTSSSKPRTLEKPAKFNPPSHPARLNRSPPRQYPGPPLSAPELEAQKTKQYPHMMPPEGSFMRWFLTNRSIHVWITLVCCVSGCRSSASFSLMHL